MERESIAAVEREREREGISRKQGYHIVQQSDTYTIKERKQY